MGRTTALGRRTFLTLSAVVAATSGCGLRVDRDPKLPTLSPTDTVRNTVARILTNTTADGDQANVRDDLLTAVGPVWSAPSELATAAPSPEPARSYKDALNQVVTTVTGAFPTLVGPTSAVLADVAVGAALVLERDFDESTVAQAFAEGHEGQGAQSSGNSSGNSAGNNGAENNGAEAGAPEGATEPGAALGAFMTACFQGEYAYERLAVKTDAESGYGTFVRGRIDAIATASESARAFATELGVTDLPANKPAWQLPSSPDNPQQLATEVERALCSTLADVFLVGEPADAGAGGTAARIHVFGLSQLFSSARASVKAGTFELLRFG